MHALFGSEVQWIFPAASSKLPLSFDGRIGLSVPVKWLRRLQTEDLGVGQPEEAA
jgi:hypothetical protein